MCHQRIDDRALIAPSELARLGSGHRGVHLIKHLCWSQKYVDRVHSAGAGRQDVDTLYLALAHLGAPAINASPPCSTAVSPSRYACNLGYAGMADASGISEDTLAWTSQWYLRQDTLRAANAHLVNAHH